MNFNNQEHLWVEKYRPQTIDECILPDAIKNKFKDIIKSGNMLNMMFCGKAGTGKTTVAKALCRELNMDWIIINCSNETGIDVLRNEISGFASTVSLTGNKKCVILDEFDFASFNLQGGLRHAIESFSKTCSFVFTCNYKNRIIEALHSRIPCIDFDIPKGELAKLQGSFYKRVVSILENEGIAYDQKVVVALIQKFYPDNRRILGQLQQFASSGSIDASVLSLLSDVSVDQLVSAMASKSFKDVRQWCAENASNDIQGLYRKLYLKLFVSVESNSIPEAILIINEYQRYDGIVPDRELHLAALCVQLMAQITFK